MKKLILVAFISFVFAQAQTCEALLQKYAPKYLDRKVVILIDKSTPFPQSIKENALITAVSALRSSTNATLYTFSEFTEGKHLALTDRYDFYLPLSEKLQYDLPQSEVKNYQECLVAWEKHLKTKFLNDSINLFKDKNENSKNSQIVLAINEIAQRTFAFSPKEQEKILFIFSDMLENSQLANFYKGKLQNIDMDKIIDKIEDEGILTDLKGADVVVIGAGLTDKGGRDYADTRNLREFWKRFIQKSNGKLIYFSDDSSDELARYYQ